MEDSKPVLGINPDIVCDIILRAREFQAKEQVVIPESTDPFSDDFDFLQVLASHKNDMTFREVKQIINNLEPDQQMALVALMYVGREDYSLDEWQECLNEATRGWTKHTAEYLLSKPHVADYLIAGLNEFGYQCDE
jgi:hypothetical protein